MPPAGQFALDLHARLPVAGNLFYSPFSLRAALAMTQAGAGGETAAEMARTLRLDGGDSWSPAAQGVTLRSANALWADEAWDLEAAFCRFCGERFGGRASAVPLKRDPKTAVGNINAWVGERTGGLIPRVLGEVPRDARLVLTNAVYFKGDWADPFEPGATRELRFHCEGGAKVIVWGMERQGQYRYAQHDGFQLLEMPYKGGEASFLVLLPAAKDGLPVLERRLTSAALTQWAAAARPTRVDVLLPRFKLEEETRTVGALKEMGLREAFTQTADFSGISASEGLFIGDIVHKAFVEVGEEGTEAAAATAVSMMLGCSMPMEEADRPPRFVADHPFLFFIRDKRGEILFIGRLADPEPAR